MVSAIVSHQLHPHAVSKREPLPEPIFIQVTLAAKWMWDITIQKMTDLKDELLALIARIINFIGSFGTKVAKAPEPKTFQHQVSAKTPLTVEVIKDRSKSPPSLEEEPQKVTPSVELLQPVPQQAQPVVVPVVQQEQQVEPLAVAVPEVARISPPVTPEPDIDRVGIFDVIWDYFWGE